MQSNSMKKANYDSIDIAKFVACLFIVGIHTYPLGQIAPDWNFVIFQGVARIGVPLFFIVSSFLLFRDHSCNAAKLKKYSSRIAILYAFWFVVFLPNTIYGFMHSTSSDPSVIAIGFIKSLLFGGTYGGSWFLTSCIFSACVIFLLSRKLNNKTILIITGLIYCFCIASSEFQSLLLSHHSYQKFISFFGVSPYCSIITGLFYFAIGKVMADSKSMLSDLKRETIVSIAVAAVFAIGLLVAEVLYDRFLFGAKMATDCCIMLVPCAVLLFILILNWNIRVKCSKQLRASSTIFYLFHVNINYFIVIMLGINSNNLIQTFVILALCAIVSAAILKLEDKKNLHWLRYSH